MLVTAMVLTACNSPNPTHAEVVALDAATGRVLWFSNDIARLASVGSMTVDDAAHSLTIQGIHCTSQTSTEDAAVVLDTRTGHTRSRPPGRPPFEDAPDEEDPTSGFPILGHDGDTDTDYELDTSSPAAALVAVPHRDGRTKSSPPLQPVWSRKLPGPDRIVRRVDSVAGTLHRRVLYVAIATSPSCGSD